MVNRMAGSNDDTIFISHMKKIFLRILLLSLPAALSVGCSNEDMTPIHGEQEAGKVVVRSYNDTKDSLQVTVSGKPLSIDDKDTFKGKIVTDYEFVFYDNQAKNIDIINKATGVVLHSYSYTAAKPVDTLSFYYKDGIWIDDVLSFKPGVLGAPGRTGYRFIFPTLNRYSNSGYDGLLDAIVKKVNGELLGIAENITKDEFSSFVEFDFGAPPVLQIEIVKHGTTESYIAGRKVIVQGVMQNNKSRMIVLDEKANESGTFTGVDGSVNLADLFDF